MNYVSAVFFVFLFLPEASFAADAANGAKLSRQCSVCHGKNGIAKDPEVANLAGQSAFYIEKSLKDFQIGAREDPRMTLIVKDLSNDDIKDLAAWYASFKVSVEIPELAATAPESNASKSTDESRKASITQKTATGDTKAGAALYKKSCRRCHGPTAKGLASFPTLRGQSIEYLIDRLERYRAGEKFGANTPLMAPQAKGLTDENIVNISKFIVSIE